MALKIGFEPKVDDLNRKQVAKSFNMADFNSKITLEPKVCYFFTFGAKLMTYNFMSAKNTELSLKDFVLRKGADLYRLWQSEHSNKLPRSFRLQEKNVLGKSGRNNSLMPYERAAIVSLRNRLAA